MAEEEKPECYGEHEKGHPECKQCELEDECNRYTGRLRSKSSKAGLSRKRAMDAMCWECNGGTSHAPDCKGQACPLYPFRKKNTGEPNLWWMGPTKTWNTEAQRARGRVTGILPDQDEGEWEESDE